MFRFPKPKDEGWFLVLGCIEDGELHALKRIPPPRGRVGQTYQLTFYTPEVVGRVVYTFYLVSDAYLGLDQQLDLRLDVEEGFSEPLEDVDDDEARLELLRRGMEEMRARKNMPEKEAKPAQNYESLGARPKVAMKK